MRRNSLINYKIGVFVANYLKLFFYGLCINFAVGVVLIPRGVFANVICIWYTKPRNNIPQELKSVSTALKSLLTAQHSNLYKRRLTVFFRCWSMACASRWVCCSSPAQCFGLILTRNDAEKHDFCASGGASSGPPSPVGGACAALALRATDLCYIVSFYRYTTLVFIDFDGGH